MRNKQLSKLPMTQFTDPSMARSVNMVWMIYTGSSKTDKENLTTTTRTSWLQYKIHIIHTVDTFSLPWRLGTAGFIYILNGLFNSDRAIYMMTSSNGNIFRVTGHVCPHKGQWRGALMFSLSCSWRINNWLNIGETGDLRRHRALYYVTVM